jgi:monoamine oxidase
LSHDVIVLGAGLAGLSAARDLALSGTDTVVLEARSRPGGRVEQAEMADGRLVQLGGEVVGPFHEAYRALVGELGLSLELAFPSLPGSDTWDLVDQHVVGDKRTWMDEADWASYEIAEEAFKRLTREVDPDDPWSHPDARQLDDISVGAWLRSAGATPGAVRARDLAMLALGAESVERTSLLADLRKEAAAGAVGFYDYDRWECERVAEGSATVATTIADELGSRIRYGSPVKSVEVSPAGCAVTTKSGERFTADAVICSIPVGPLRHITVTGASPERLASLHRQRHALVTKAVFVYQSSFWESGGQNGACYSEAGLVGGTWAQKDGILSCLVPPERLAPLLAGPAHLMERELTADVTRMLGSEAQTPQAFFARHWGTDPWTLGYITAWRPGDVWAVGPLHGTHDPPLYICGSDQWVCGYMEGAVRTGRAAAAAALARG